MTTIAHQLSPSFSHKGNPGFSRNRYRPPARVPVDLYILILTNYDVEYDPANWSGSDPYGYARSLWVHDVEQVDFRIQQLESIGVTWWCDIVHYPFDIAMRYEPPGSSRVIAHWEAVRRHLPLGFDGVIHPGLASTKIRVFPSGTYGACEGVGVYESLWEPRRSRDDSGPQLAEPYVGYGRSWAYRGDDPPPNTEVISVLWEGPDPVVPFDGTYRWGRPTGEVLPVAFYKLTDEGCPSGAGFLNVVNSAGRTAYPDEAPEFHSTGFVGVPWPVFEGNEISYYTWRSRTTLRMIDDFMTEAFGHITAWHGN